MRFIKLAIVIILGILISIFAANNNQQVELNLYPLPFEVETPFFLIVFFFVFVGVILGGFTLSIKSAYWKRVAKSNKKRVAKLEEKAKTKPSTSTDITV